MLDKLRMNRYMAKIDEKATTIEPYRQMFGNKSLGKAFFDKSSDQFDGFTMGSFAAWKAGIPPLLWAAVCAQALIDGTSVGSVIDIAEKMFPQHRLHWRRHSAVLNELSQQLP
jgi:hypothetical protein